MADKRLPDRNTSVCFERTALPPEEQLSHFPEADEAGVKYLSGIDTETQVRSSALYRLEYAGNIIHEAILRTDGAGVKQFRGVLRPLPGRRHSRGTFSTLQVCKSVRLFIPSAPHAVTASLAQGPSTVPTCIAHLSANKHSTLRSPTFDLCTGGAAAQRHAVLAGLPADCFSAQCMQERLLSPRRLRAVQPAQRARQAARMRVLLRLAGNGSAYFVS